MTNPGKNVIDVLPYGSIREVAPKQDGHGYTDQYGRYIPALPDLKSKRYWELDPKLIKRGNVKKHQSGGRTQYEIGSLPWFGREVKNLFRGIIEGRKPSDYDPRTQTFRGDGVKLQGGNFGGGGGGSWPTPQYAPKPDKPLLVPIVMQRSFNDAYAEARRKGQSTFWFNGRLYNTKRGGGSEAQKAGSRRFEVTKVGAMPEP